MKNINTILGSTLAISSRPYLNFNKGLPAQNSLYSSDRWDFAVSLNGSSTKSIAVKSLNYHDDKIMAEVCKEISWSDVNINFSDTSSSKKHSVILPISNEFLLGFYEIRERCTVPQESLYWLEHLPLNCGFQYVYGYKLTNSGKITPIPTSEANNFSDFDSDEDIIKNAFNDAVNIDIPFIGKIFGSSTKGKETALHVASPRFLVCISLICCDSEKRFEPKKVLDAARIYPLTMIKANRLVKSTQLIETSITLTRGKKANGHHHGMTDQMSADRSIALFADRNIKFHGAPEWDNVFDYYDVKPTSTYSVVDPRRAGPRKDFFNRKVARSSFGDSVFYHYDNSEVIKEPRQGDFDNVHIAPKMILKDHEVVMAPICQHDCFHTHFRWGSALGEDKHLQGWSSLLPFQSQGAPLVPQDQQISLLPINTNDVCGYKYTARIINANFPRLTQFIFHHGSAYGLNVDDWLVSLGVVMEGGNSWAQFYHNLRYAHGTRQGDLPWIKEDPGAFMKLMKL